MRTRRVRMAVVASVSLLALLAASPALASSPVVGSYSGVEPATIPSSTIVATFNDGLLLCTAASAYTATVDWGDGPGPQPATVTGPSNPLLGPCDYAVTAGHMYPEAGTYTVTVNVTGGGTPGQSTGSATVADAALNAGSAITINPTENSPFTGPVATFTDANTAATASDYTATITWGDGSTSPATTITSTGTPGQFNVGGTHTYTGAGSHATSVAVKDTDGQTITLPGTANILSAGTPITINQTENSQFTGPVASFSDANTGAPAGNYNATITWGDGSTSTGRITGTGGQFNVDGTHTYAEAGNQVTSVAVTDTDGSTVTLPGNANITDATLSAGTPITITPTENSPFTGPVATFTDANTAAPATDYSATITWGDGSTSPATSITSTGTPGQFSVNGNHTYAEAGNQVTSVAVTDTDGSTVTIPGNANIADATLTAGTPTTITPTVNSPFTGPVATFTDANTAAPADDYTATITWGDGSTSTATITSTGTAGQFNVNGTHTYASTGSHPTSVAVTDTDGSTVTLPGTATVAAAPPPPPPPPYSSLSIVQKTPVRATAGSNFSGLIATYQDLDTAARVSDYAATISWGDGSTSAGTIVAGNTAGVYGVVGSHTYSTAGPYTVGVAVTGPRSSTLHIDVSATVVPRPLPTFSLTLSHASVIHDREMVVTVGCPASETTCRGWVSAVQVTGRGTSVLSTLLLILPGGKSGTFDLRFTRAAARRLGRQHTVTLKVVAVAVDPAKGHDGGASEIVPRATGKRK